MIAIITSGLCGDPSWKEYDPLSVIDPKSHTIITVPTSRSENSTTYLEAFYPLTRGFPRMPHLTDFERGQIIGAHPVRTSLTTTADIVDASKTIREKVMIVNCSQE
ncbi:hypothetical protein AVEN_115028-1 [Araneus ventricosus]|uniref:Uncharacterized protein n=1 Tax=Araneus ventricosus TaxID=182803 RepID=A0A4Y1ZXZ6_ARAVE|nr:hypothetical protein AVEN_115028-1 [Araneus ventricosus]